MKNLWITFLAGTALLCSTGAARAGNADILISGKKVVVKDNVDGAKRRAIAVSKDNTLNVTGLDPTVGGAFFYLIDPVPGMTSSEFFLPAGNWTSKNGKYTYVDKDLVNGPVKKAKLKNGLFKIVLKGSEIDFPILGVAPIGQVGGVFTVSSLFPTVRICFLFPGTQGTVKKDSPTKGIYKAIRAEAPPFCPVVS